MNPRPRTSSTRRRIHGWAVARLSAIALLSVAIVAAASANPVASRSADSRVVSNSVERWGSLADIPGVTFQKLLSPTPARLPGQVAQVATSNSTYYALLTNGRVYAFGMGNKGQLGNGRTRNSANTPVRVRFPAGVKIAYLPTNVMPYDTGLAVDTTGHAWGWGVNAGGELCLGNRRRQLVPVKLPFTHVTALAGAFQHAVYEAAGQVWACGRGRLGELGDGKFHKSFVPVKVRGLGPSAHVVTLVAAFGNAGALLANGRYLNWGTNGLGQLGINSPAKRKAVPVAVPLPAGVTQVAQGGSAPGNGQTLVKLKNGAFYGWGADFQGQLGDGTRTPKFSPVKFSPPSGVTYELLASNGSTSYGVTPAGDVYAWGAGQKGQIGNGTKRGSLTPVKVASHAIGISGTAYNVLNNIG